VRVSSTFNPDDLEQTLEYAKQEFELSARDASGSTLRDQLLSVQRQTGRVPVELQNLVELPESCSNVWHWFIDLHNNRTSNGFSENIISFSDIQAYFSLIGISPEKWEIVLLKKLDSIAMRFIAKEAEKRQKNSQKKKPSK